MYTMMFNVSALNRTLKHHHILNIFGWDEYWAWVSIYSKFHFS